MKLLALTAITLIMMSCASGPFKNYCDPLYLDSEDDTSMLIEKK